MLPFISSHVKRMRTPLIPLNVFMFWHTSDLPPKMKESVKYTVRSNPEFMFHLYTEDMARNYIKDNYNKDVLDAYDRLIPIAYKSDLFRYCILYNLGGIYMDIKLQPTNHFKLISLTDKEYFVLDPPIFHNDLGLTNGFIVVKPLNPVMLECVNRIVQNVKTKYMGRNQLYPTGPGLLGESYAKFYTNRTFALVYPQSSRRSIKTYNGTEILKEYDGYRDDMIIYLKGLYYGDAWDHGKIYENERSI